MTAQDPSSAHNLDGYGAPEIAWTRVREVLNGEITQGPDTGAAEPYGATRFDLTPSR